MLAIVRRATQTVSDEAGLQALIEVGIRLRASAMTYLALRPPQDAGVRDLGQELAALCSSISNSMLSARGIALTLSSDPVAIDAFRCWQISLIVSELVVNAARHAFREREEGAISVKVSARGGYLECTVSDDGRPYGVASPGRGSAIVNALIRDLSGTISREYSDRGSSISLFVPLTDTILIPRAASRNEIVLRKPPFGFLRIAGSADQAK